MNEQKTAMRRAFEAAHSSAHRHPLWVRVGRVLSTGSGIKRPRSRRVRRARKS